MVVWWFQNLHKTGSFVSSWVAQPQLFPGVWETQKCLKFSSVAQLCPTLCDPMDCSTPGLPVHHQLSELAQTHVH